MTYENRQAVYEYRIEQEKIAQGNYPKLSPFSAIRWKLELPEVKVEEEWYKLLAIDGLTTKEILDFSRQTFEEEWRKGFEEDLVELLIKMGHDPGTSVKLDLQQLDSGQTVVKEDVEMTYENRFAIKIEALKREAVEKAADPESLR